MLLVGGAGLSQLGELGENISIIRNGGQPRIVTGEHNDICHSPQLIADVVQALSNISERKAMQQRMRLIMSPGR